MTHRVAIIGTGADPEERDRDGYAMAYRHAPGYERLDDCELVTCADIVPENAEAFAERFGFDTVYTDHESMLRDEDIDIVSVCTPPTTHADIVVDCAGAGVDAVHCEKPMATRWTDCKEMVAACEDAGVQLTIDHQRRFAEPVIVAKQLLDDGEIGDLVRLEWAEVNLFDAGSHLFDLCDYITDGTTPEWVLASVDPDPHNRWFGALNEVQSIAQWGYADGTQGFASTADNDGEPVVDAYLRIVGEEGVIEIQPDDGPPLRVRSGGGWEKKPTGGESVYAPGKTTIQAAKDKLADSLPGFPAATEQTSHYERAIEHAVETLTDGTEPRISGRRVLRGTELVFGAWESARRRERVTLPLADVGNPLEALCAEKYSGETDRADQPEIEQS